MLLQPTLLSYIDAYPRQPKKEKVKLVHIYIYISTVSLLLLAAVDIVPSSSQCCCLLCRHNLRALLDQILQDAQPQTR